MEYIIVTAVIGITYWYVKYLVDKHDQADRGLQSWNNQSVGYKVRARGSRRNER